MRVLISHFTKLGAVGGVGVAGLDLARALRDLGHAVGFAQMSDFWKPVQRLSNEIPVWSVAAPSFPSMQRPRSWASFVRSSWQFQSILCDFRPDIVHVQFPSGQALPIVGAHALPHRWRLIVTVHGSDIKILPFTEPRLKPWQERLFRRADAVTSVGQGLLDDAKRLYPCISAKAHVIYNSVGKEWFEGAATHPQPSGQKYVLFVGRLAQVKGVDLLLRAWVKVCGEFPGIQLWLVGDGPEHESLHQLAADLGITPSIRFLGAKAQEELRQLYRDSEYLVLPSRSEGLPLTLLEAGACAALCIASNIPGNNEVVEDGITGFLFEPDSSDSLASSMLHALRLSPGERQQLIAAALTRTRERFTQERMISSYISLYENALHGKT